MSRGIFDMTQKDGEGMQIVFGKIWNDMHQIIGIHNMLYENFTIGEKNSIT